MLRVGTRGSALARWQSARVMQRLRSAHPGLSVEERVCVTQGDLDRDTPLSHFAGPGVFTNTLSRALVDGEIDMAVHSLKDLPLVDEDGVTTAALTERGDPREALLSRRGLALSELPREAIVGTSSRRRAAQLRALNKDWHISDLRGPVGDRVEQLHRGNYDAIVLAVAGLDRLGLRDAITQVLPFATMLPAPGQAALAVQCRADDADTLRALRLIDDERIRVAVTVERAFLRALGAGDDAPAGAYAAVTRGRFPRLYLQTIALTHNGVILARTRDVVPLGNAARLGEIAAHHARAQAVSAVNA